MKVAVVYNRDQKGTINVFGMQNREWYPEETIQRVVGALESGGHEVYRIPADRSLLSNLKKFLPKLSKRRPNGIVFNLALGVQGKCRYTHVPAILEVAGIPYTGSSPMGHTLAQDKVVAKQIFLSSNLPTPNYRVFLSEDLDAPHLNYPIIVKPRSEAASFGLKTVNDNTGLREAIAEIINEYRQPALAEEFIEGREVNVSLLGNAPPGAMPVLELILGDGKSAVYSHESKFYQKNAGRVKKVCPAGLPPETSAYIQELAVRVFEVLNIFDYGRVDFRLDRYNQPYILELNSMASVNPGSSFVTAARKSGLSYEQLINRIIDVAVKRYSREEPDYFQSEDQSSRKQHNRDV